MNNYLGIGKPRTSMPQSKLLHFGEKLSIWREYLGAETKQESQLGAVFGIPITPSGSTVC